MNIFNRKKKLTFLTIEFASVPGLFDYPRYLSIPRIGEIVIMDNHSGKVTEIRHIISGSVSEIRIVCTKW